jgi:hypothetical protein
MAIWQDLVDQQGFAAGYASVQRFVKTLQAMASPDAHPVIVTAPGEEAQVDYGDGAMVRHPQTGKYRRTRLFVLTLGYSRKAVRLLTWKSSTRLWAESTRFRARELPTFPEVGYGGEGGEAAEAVGVPRDAHPEVAAPRREAPLHPLERLAG